MVAETSSFDSDLRSALAAAPTFYRGHSAACSCCGEVLLMRALLPTGDGLVCVRCETARDSEASWRSASVGSLAQSVLAILGIGVLMLTLVAAPVLGLDLTTWSVAVFGWEGLLAVSGVFSATFGASLFLGAARGRRAVLPTGPWLGRAQLVVATAATLFGFTSFLLAIAGLVAPTLL
jgi:hypothetical protein